MASAPGTPANALDGGAHRLLLMEELSRRFPATGPGGLLRSLRFLRKKYARILIVGGAKFIKRSIDIVVSATMLIALLPLFLTVAAIVKLTDRGPLRFNPQTRQLEPRRSPGERTRRGPVMYFQTRVGRYGREFQFPKLRSMIVNAAEVTPALIAAGILEVDPNDGRIKNKKDDPRMTRIGKFIRKLSIDELPQLWCVLKGDMSLVGPRPPIPSEVAKYTLKDRRRLDVTPGLTCFWQVQGRSLIPFEQQVQMDVDYIHSQSLWVDIKILFQTVPAVLFGRGAF
jgi:lipopolysaccharide/colanic/teichoic acid biosynthesis glycosyltransferase